MMGVANDPDGFRAVFEGTGEGFVLVDDDGRCVEATSSATAVLGIERDRLEGASIGEVAPGETDLDFTRGGATTATRDGVSSDGRRNGASVETAMASVTDETHLVVVRDASDGVPAGDGLSARAELLARAFASSAVGILVVSVDDEVVDVNGQASRLFGMERSAMVGRRFDELPWAEPTGEVGALARTPDSISAEDEGSNETRPDDGVPLDAVRTTNDAVVDVERAVERPDGTRAWLSIDAAPMAGRDTADRVLISLEDVTNRDGYRRLLAAQDERLDAYSETVNHDLRGPLSIAHGWLEVAIEDGQTDGLEKAKTALDRMADHMDELRGVARYSRTARDLTALPVLPVAEAAWSELAPEDATLSVDEDVGTIHADRERLHALFEALFRNSIENTDGTVTVRVGGLDDGFYVADDGDGIPDDVRDRVFEFGYSTNADGAGLGLSLVEAVADAHGWTITLTDAEPSGARFEFRPRWHPERDG